jgi:hypothetical protein
MRNFYGNVLQIVDTCASDSQGVLLGDEIGRRRGDFFRCQREAQTAGFECTAQTSNYTAAVKTGQTAVL